MASSVLPRFQPTVIWLATAGAVGSVCASAVVGDKRAKVAVDSNAMNAAAVRHFAAEGLRSDMRIPPVDQSIDLPAERTCEVMHCRRH
jgi:hypothetical protein